MKSSNTNASPHCFGKNLIRITIILHSHPPLIFRFKVYNGHSLTKYYYKIVKVKTTNSLGIDFFEK